MPPQPVSGNNGWKNYVLTILTTILITSTTAWLSFGRDTVRKDELQPLQTAVVKLSESVQKLSTEVAVLNTRLEGMRGK